MKSFCLKILWFILTVFFISVVGVYAVYKLIDTGDYYKINSKKENVVFGHSHSETAFNDSMIKNTLNVSNGGENVFYTYFKVKKVLENNTTIKRVFISFSNIQIDRKSDDDIWDEKYIDKWFSKYGAYMSYEDLKILAVNNPKGFIKVQSITMRDYLIFLAKRDASIIKSMSWGAYAPHKGTHLDTTASVVNNQEKPFQYSEINLEYMRKTIDLCKEKGVKVYLVRAPIHKKWNALQNEVYFQELVNNSFKDVVFLDFKDFPLLNSDFLDANHLNENGAFKFSKFFNHIVETKIIDEDNIQELIVFKLKSFEDN